MVHVGRNEHRCKYNGGSCPNQRALDRHGRRLIRLCEYHQYRAGLNQARYLQRRQMQQRPLPPGQAQPVTLPVRVPAPVAAVSAPVPTAAPSPIVVVVIAGNPTALQGLSGAQPFGVFSRNASDTLSDFLRTIVSGGSDATVATVDGPQAALTAQMMAALAQAPSVTTGTVGLEPLPLTTQPTSEATAPVVPYDADWFSDFR